MHLQLTPLDQISEGGKEETDAPTHVQQAPVPKKEGFVLEKTIIDVSYFVILANQATALKPVKLVAKSDHYGHAMSITTANQLYAQC